MSEIHFGKEAIKELDELKDFIDWKKKENELGKLKEIKSIMRWLEIIQFYILYPLFEKEEFARSAIRIADLCRAARGHIETYTSDAFYF